MSETPTCELKPEAIAEARRRIAAWATVTPLATSRTLDEQLEARVAFKCEQLQRVGAFKFRGASHALTWLSPAQRAAGVVTHSSGNHAQALALAARLQGMTAYVVMPENAPEVKRQAVIGYGGKVIPCVPTLEARESTCAQVQSETNATLVHPYDDPRVIIGQGTAAAELLESLPDLDLLLAPVGGGGLISGTCLAVAAAGSSARVWGVEPAGADDAFRSKAAGEWIPQTDPNTIADGLKTSLGEWTWPFVRDQVERIITVSDAEIVSAMRWMWERMKLVVEPSSATVLAALRQVGPAELRGKKVGAIISGGNVDLARLPWQD